LPSSLFSLHCRVHRDESIPQRIPHFTIQGLGAPFVEGVDGDPNNVLGVSVSLLRRMLAEVGVAITDLWRWPRAGREGD